MSRRTAAPRVPRGVAPALAGVAWGVALLASAAAAGETLTLDEVLDQVARFDPKMQGAALLREVAASKVTEKRGAFDPKLNYKSDQIRFVDGASSVTKQKNQVYFEQPTRAGIKWFAGARLTDTSVVGKKGHKDFERGFVGIKIPLLRNSRWNEKLVAERQAELGVPLAEAEQREIRLAMLQKAGEAYWEWVAAARALAVTVDMLGLAEVRAKAIDEQVARGDKPELTAVEAQREIQKRLGSRAKARRNLEKAALKLGLFLWDDAGQPGSPPGADQAPPDLPPPASLTDAELAAAEVRALENRPELAALEVERKALRLDLSLARNDGRPDLDLFLNSGRESELDVFEPIERRLRAGIKVSVPLRRRAPRGRADATRWKLRKLELEVARLRQEILVQVRDAASRLRADLDRYEAAVAEVSLARTLEEGERTSFDLGDGTLFLVNQRERSRGSAEIQRLEVAADYHQGRLAFSAIVGDL